MCGQCQEPAFKQMEKLMHSFLIKKLMPGSGVLPQESTEPSMALKISETFI